MMLTSADRQKATRILKRVKKELAAAEDEEEKAVLQKKLHNAEVDVNYAISYPLMKPYSSLYPKSKKTKATETDDSDEAKGKSDEIDGPKGDVMVWKMVEQAMEEGTLEALRNSKSREEIPGAPPKKSKTATAKTKASKEVQPKKTYAPQEIPKNRREARAAAREAEAEDEDSDGGFFE